MANNYRQFCEYLEFPEDKELAAKARTWWSDILTVEEMEPDDLRKTLQGYGIRAESVDIDYWPDFQTELSARGICLYSEEFSNIDNILVTVQAYLKKFQPNGVFTLEWADFCSKVRVDEFGGGVAVVTATQVEVATTGGLRREIRDRLLGGVNNGG